MAKLPAAWPQASQQEPSQQSQPLIKGTSSSPVLCTSPNLSPCRDNKRQTRSPGRISHERSSPLHHSGMRESIGSSSVLRDISPTRVFTQGGAWGVEMSKVSLPDLFKQKQGIASLRPTYSLDGEQPREESPQPKLLQRLEAVLDEKLSMVERFGAATKGFAATQMRTDAYRQVFDAFLHSFTTYSGLLGRIKSVYDAALDDALASVYDNVHMHSELAGADQKLDTAVRLARQKALEDAAAQRSEIQDDVDRQEEIAAAAELRVQEADNEICAIKANIALLKLEAQELTQANMLQRQNLLAQSSFATPALLAWYQVAKPSAPVAATAAATVI